MNERSAQSGFALIVISALFLGFALIAAVMIDRSNATQLMSQNEITRARVNRLSYALLQYAVFTNNRFPCPASLTVAVTSPATFGVPVTANCASGTPSGVTVLPGSGMLRGMVPIQALLPYGVDFNDAFDAWNNRILYVVDRQMTTMGSGTPTGSADRAVITEENVVGAQFYQPDFMVMSYGRDGFGATPRNASPVTPTISCSGTSTVLRQENCDDDLNFVQGPPTMGTNATASTYFDDILSFHGQ